MIQILCVGGLAHESPAVHIDRIAEISGDFDAAQ